MAITIDWGTQIINIPKSYTTLVQASPTEIRELPLNQFRLDLKALEADLEGIPHLRTHNHNTEVLLGGIVYARIIEIINGYTITFEDGQYAVNLTGANSNVGDVVNVNSVSVRSANAAGLISNQAIEYASYNRGVTVDAINGVVGTIFPKGTPQSPVNNIPNAVTIAELRGFNTIYVRGDYTFGTGDILVGYNIYGESAENSNLTFLSGSSVAGVNLFDATIDGVFDGKANFTDCHLTSASFIEGTLTRCFIEGDVTLDGSGNTTLIDCVDGVAISGVTPSIDFGGSGSSLGIRNYSGDIALRNKNGPEGVEINISTGGSIIIENTVTNGLIRVTGIADVTDNTTSGATVDTSRVIYPDQLQLSSFNGSVYLNTIDGTSGIKYPQGTLQHPVSNLDDALTIANLRGLDTILFDGTVVVTDTDVSGRIFIGENNLEAVLYFVGSGNTTTACVFKNMILAGRLNGHCFAESCALQTLSNIGSTSFPTVFRDCIVRADVGPTPALSFNSISGGQNVHFINCVSGVPGQGTSTLDFNNSDIPVAFRKYGGGITLKNITGNQDSTFEFDEGQIKIDSSCTSGTIRLGGIYKLTDNGALTIEERNQSITNSISGGTFTGDTQAIAAAVWDKLTADHETANTFGKMINDILVATGQAQHSINVQTELLKNKPNN